MHFFTFILQRMKMAAIILALLYFALASEFGDALDFKGLEAKVKLLEKNLDAIKNVVSSSVQYCHLQPSNICGPCTCIDDPKTMRKYFCDCRGLGPKRDCTEFNQQGIKVDGIYLVNHNQPSLKNIQVFCDQNTDGGGWTVIQRRIDGTENFYRDWESYKIGFGDLDHEFWIGNQNIHTLELQSRFGYGTEIRIDMMSRSRNTFYAKYSWFLVGNEKTNYILHLGGYSGDAGDAFSIHNGMMFSTVDRDNDKDSSDNCAQKLGGGGWWWKSCGYVSLNSMYYHYGQSTQSNGYNGIVWYPKISARDSLKRTEMKIRRKL